MSDLHSLDLGLSVGDGHSEAADGHQVQQRESPRVGEALATIVPRRRVILDWEPVLKRIVGQVVLRNRSEEAFAFKYETNLTMLSANPERGVLMPGEHVALSLLLDDEFEGKGEFEKDACDLLIAPFSVDQLKRDGVDLEDFVGSAFPHDMPLEKHVLQPALSKEAVERLEILSADKEAKRQAEDDVQRLKQILYPSIGVIITLLTLYILFTDFCLPLQLPPERPRRF